MNAQEFAIKSHGEQKYGELPYSVHLAAVENVLLRFGFNEQCLLDAAWLHDVLEDTSVKAGELEAQFGKEVTEIVISVTSEPGVNRKERNAKTYPKTAANRLGTILKLADRIANVEHSIKTASSLFGMYKKEQSSFWAALPHTEENRVLWSHLNGLLVPQAQ